MNWKEVCHIKFERFTNQTFFKVFKDELGMFFRD